MSPWLLLLLAGGLLQSTLLSRLTVVGVHPNLILGLVIYWALFRGARAGLIWGLVGGLVLDTLSILPFGTFTVSLATIAFLVGLTEGLPFGATRLLPIALVLVASPLFHLIAAVMMETLGWSVAWGSLWRMLLPAALLDAALVFLLYPLMRRLSELAGEREIEWA